MGSQKDDVTHLALQLAVNLKENLMVSPKGCPNNPL